MLRLSDVRLKWRIFAYLLGFCSLLLVLLWLLQTVFLTDMYKFVRKRELNQAIAAVAREIDNPALQSVIQQIHAESDIFVAPTLGFVPPARPGADIQGRPGGPPIETITKSKEFTLENGQMVSLTFYALIAPVSATVSTLRIQVYVITAVMLLFSVFLAFVIARRISQPIEEISQSALTLAKGDYGTRFRGKGFREIVTLSETLNTAAIELGRVEELRRELLANVSHDLRTPLALIYSYAELMYDFPDEVTPEQTKVIMNETERLTILVNDVLDISKLESGIERLNSEVFNLTHSIKETVDRTRQLLKREGFTVSFFYDEDVAVRADEIKIGRAFYNLLVNAVNYSGDSHIVEVRQTASTNHVRISVRDYGEGVAEADMPFVWDRYYRSAIKHKRALTGTGLGLSIVKKVVDMHGGTYGATSEPGKGSIFWLELQRE